MVSAECRILTGVTRAFQSCAPQPPPPSVSRVASVHVPDSAPGVLATFRTRSVARTLPRRSEMMGRRAMKWVEAVPAVEDDVLEFMGTLGGSLEKKPEVRNGSTR